MSVTPPQTSTLVCDPEDLSYVTSDDELSTESVLDIERLSRSAEHTLANDADTEYEMREELNRLRVNILSTQNELENSILENNILKRTITKLSKELELLKSVCLSPVKI